VPPANLAKSTRNALLAGEIVDFGVADAGLVEEVTVEA
jgi:hypothetical protein